MCALQGNKEKNKNKYISINCCKLFTLRKLFLCLWSSESRMMWFPSSDCTSVHASKTHKLPGLLLNFDFAFWEETQNTSKYNNTGCQKVLHVNIHLQKRQEVFLPWQSTTRQSKKYWCILFTKIQWFQNTLNDMNTIWKSHRKLWNIVRGCESNHKHHFLCRKVLSVFENDDQNLFPYASYQLV